MIRVEPPASLGAVGDLIMGLERHADRGVLAPIISTGYLDFPFDLIGWRGSLSPGRPLSLSESGL